MLVVAGDIPARPANLSTDVLIRLLILGEVVADIELVVSIDLVVDSQQDLVVIGQEREHTAVRLEQVDGALWRCQRRAQRRRGVSGQGIEDRILGRSRLKDGQIGEHRHAGRLASPELLVGGEKEGPVLHDGPAQRSAELLPAGRRLDARDPVVLEHDRKRVAGVQALMAEEAKGGAVEIVAARLGYDIDHAATCAAELGRVGGAIDLKFLDGLLADSGAHATAGVVRLAAVDGDAVAAAVASVEGESAVRRLLDAEAVGVGLGLGIGDTGREQCERQVIPPVDRQVANGRFVNGIGLLRALGVDQRSLGRDFHHLAALADRQLEVDIGDLAHGQLDALSDLRRKAGLLYFDIVKTGRQQHYAIVSVGAAPGFAPDSGVRSGDRDFRISHNSLCGIADRSVKVAVVVDCANTLTAQRAKTNNKVIFRLPPSGP